MTPQWDQFLAALTLALIRISGMVAFAPFLSSTALPVRTKAVFALAVSYLVAPLVASLPGSRVTLSYSALIGELAVGLVYGLTLAFLNEMLLFAGQIAGLQFSFSLVNLMDPASSIQTPLLSELFQLMGTLVVISGGLDHLMLASLVRSFSAVPLGSYAMATATTAALVQAAAGIFLAALQLAAPVLVATLLVEIAVALLARLSPQLPVISMTVPLKTLTGFGLLSGSLALWSHFIDVRFRTLLDWTERLITMQRAGG